MNHYKPGDFLRHRDANQIGINESALFGSDRSQPTVARVELKTPVAMPAYSVVRLGDTSTPMERPPILTAKNPLTDGTGPCYTNGGLETGTDQRAPWYPIGLVPVQLRVDGDIATGDRANVTDNGQAKKGEGPLYCTSEKNGQYAFFVQVAEPNSIRRVRLEQIGGNAGSENTTCDFTYNAFDPKTGEQITGGPFAPDDQYHPRQANLEYAPALSGEMMFDGDDKTLLVCNEEPNFTPDCE